LKLAALVLTLL